ncbi:MAG: helix-turn-helix domain-containing protein [Lachnospiraceae bacterium]
MILPYSAYHKHELEYFAVDLPNGRPEYTLVHFLEPVKIVINGKTTITEPNAVILIEAKHAHYYEAVNQIIYNTFLHMTPPRGFFADFDIPMNEILYLPCIEELDTMLKKICYCALLESPYKEKELEAYLNLLFIQISKQLQQKKNRDPVQDNEEILFSRIRLTIFSNVAQKWTSASMAKLSNLSTTQFYKKYKQYFHVTPKEDLLQFRFESAKTLITDGRFSLSECSNMLGFENLHYFSDFFRKRSGGISASEYRKQNPDKKFQGYDNDNMHL